MRCTALSTDPTETLKCVLLFVCIWQLNNKFQIYITILHSISYAQKVIHALKTSRGLMATTSFNAINLMLSFCLFSITPFCCVLF